MRALARARGGRRVYIAVDSLYRVVLPALLTRSVLYRLIIPAGTKVLAWPHKMISIGPYFQLVLNVYIGHTSR
jgi:hypothetical protein